MPKANHHITNGQALAPRPEVTRSLSSGSVYRAGQRGGLVLGLGQDPQLISRIQKDIAALGVVGEENNSLLNYLTGTSRMLAHPLRLIIRGSSGAGKSFPQSKVASLFPPGEVVEATSLTPQALYYGKENWLQHKFLVKGERSHRTDEEGAEQTAALRQLISEDKITKQVTIKMETVTVEQKGPIAFCETTTSQSIFSEDLNRCLQVWADDSAEQTKRILIAAAEAYAQPSERDTSDIVKRHHEFQASLTKAEVAIPFAMELAEYLAAEKLEARRIFKQLLATVETVAFLHQHQRHRDGDGRLLATQADYAIARRLLLPSLDEAIGVGAGLQKSLYLLQENFAQKNFTTSEAIKKKVFNNKMTAATVLKQLVSRGVLRCVAESKGSRPAEWGWTGKVIRPVLPPSVKA